MCGMSFVPQADRLPSPTHPLRSTPHIQNSKTLVIDVIFCYTDLRMWCSAMRERSALRAKYFHNFNATALNEDDNGSSRGSSGTCMNSTHQQRQHPLANETKIKELPATDASIAAAACVQPNAAYKAYRSKVGASACVFVCVTLVCDVCCVVLYQPPPLTPAPAPAHAQLEEAAILMDNERRATTQAKPTPAKNHRFDR